MAAEHSRRFGSGPPPIKDPETEFRPEGLAQRIAEADAGSRPAQCLVCGRWLPERRQRRNACSPDCQVKISAQRGRTRALRGGR